MGLASRFVRSFRFEDAFGYLPSSGGGGIVAEELVLSHRLRPFWPHRLVASSCVTLEF
jgi:hypothetical protein